MTLKRMSRPALEGAIEQCEIGIYLIHKARKTIEKSNGPIGALKDRLAALKKFEDAILVARDQRPFYKKNFKTVIDIIDNKMFGTSQLQGGLNSFCPLIFWALGLRSLMTDPRTSLDEFKRRQSRHWPQSKRKDNIRRINSRKKVMK